MRILLNSDILYSGRPLATGLPGHINEFCRDAGSVGAIIVLPTTVVLEYERHQRQLVDEQRADIDKAVKLLAQRGVALPPVDAAKLVPDGDLVEALRATGIQVEREDPRIEDYREAERRACLHLSPQPPVTKTDEMRDLVIWQVALRIAQRDGRALLVSRDEVHTHDRGATEAESVGLLRARDLDDALYLIGRESPAGALARSVLAVVWGDLRSVGLPLPEAVVLRRVRNLHFVADNAGHASGTLEFLLETGAGPLSGSASVSQVAPNRVETKLGNLRLSDVQWQSGALDIITAGELPKVVLPVEERLQALKSVLEGEQ